MAFSGPVARGAAGLLLFIALLVPSVSAQVPDIPTDPMETTYGFAVVAPKSFAEVNYLGNALLPLFVHDLSRDSGNARELPTGGAGASPVGHTVSLRVAEIIPADYEGWQVLVGQPVIPTIGGDVIETSILVATTPMINTQQITAVIEAVFEGPNGYMQNQTLIINAEVANYDVALVQVTNPTAAAGQYEKVQFQVRVLNDGVYPDSFSFDVKTDKAGFIVVPPPNLYVPPKSERYTNVTVITPKDAVYEFGKNAVITVQARSVTGNGVYTTVGVLKVHGPYIPVYWIPLILVGMVSTGILVKERREQAELRRLGKGKPRRVEPTPRQAVLLAELKRKDPEAYKERKARLDAIYAQRREKYRGERKERAARDREEHRQAMAEMKEERRAKAAAAKEAKKQAALDKKAAKKQARLDKKAAKKQAKVDKKEAKILAKKRGKLEKQKAKLEKKAEKAAAKQAKVDAKAEKAAAKQAKREARAAEKREKSR